MQNFVLSAAARTFAERLLLRHPDWEPFVRQYQRAYKDDASPTGRLWLEVPSPGDPTVALWAIVQDREVLVGLGYTEALFISEPAEREQSIDDALNFIDDIATAEVVRAWERHRFFWRTWESCHLRRAADVIKDPKVVRVSAWPATIEQRRAAAT